MELYTLPELAQKEGVPYEELLAVVNNVQPGCHSAEWRSYSLLEVAPQIWLSGPPQEKVVLYGFVEQTAKQPNPVNQTLPFGKTGLLGIVQGGITVDEYIAEKRLEREREDQPPLLRWEDPYPTGGLTGLRGMVNVSPIVDEYILEKQQERLREERQF